MTLTGRMDNSRLISDEERVFGTLFRRLYPRLVKIAVHYTFDIDAAEDIVQESFLRLWHNRNRLTHYENLESYLAAGVRNSCLNWLKHRKIKDKYVNNYIADEFEADHAEREIFIAKIHGMFMRLPEKRREIMRLNIFEGRSYAEIAAIMDISLNTVKDHIKKAYAFIRQGAFGKDIQG